jgi:hypothetical protein
MPPILPRLVRDVMVPLLLPLLVRHELVLAVDAGEYDPVHYGLAGTGRGVATERHHRRRHGSYGRNHRCLCESPSK